MPADLSDLINVSRKYGADPDWVLVGGGNTSLKEDGILYVKASGSELATIDEKGFVKMSMEAFGDIWNRSYPPDEAAREAAVLEDMMAAREPGQDSRPSVEALLHSLIRGRLVVHTHPALINGITCGADGEEAVEKLFGDSALWVPLTKPGYILAKEIRDRLEAAAAAGKPYPELLFLENHGLFVGGETVAEIESLQNRVAERVASALKRKPSTSAKPVSAELVKSFNAEAEKAWGRRLEIRAAVNPDILVFADDDSSFEPLRLPFNPDQIVYSGPGPVRIDKLSELSAAVEKYTAGWKREPQAVLLKGVGLFTAGDSTKKADSALALMLDTVKIAVYAESFGGAKPMTDELIVFIRDWEVEHYRAKQSK